MAMIQSNRHGQKWLKFSIRLPIGYKARIDKRAKAMCEPNRTVSASGTLAKMLMDLMDQES